MGYGGARIEMWLVNGRNMVARSGSESGQEEVGMLVIYKGIARRRVECAMK